MVSFYFGSALLKIKPVIIYSQLIMETQEQCVRYAQLTTNASERRY